MADWKQIPDTDVDPDAPVTSELMYALRDNPVAIAEGASGAPRIEPQAVKSYPHRLIGTTNTTAGVNFGNLGAFANVEVYIGHNRPDTGSSTPGSFRFRVSGDNGNTWTSYNVFTGVARASGFLILDLTDGRWFGASAAAFFGSESTGGAARNNADSGIALPASGIITNIQVSMNANLGTLICALCVRGVKDDL